jgi:hypothetical protein
MRRGPWPSGRSATILNIADSRRFTVPRRAMSVLRETAVSTLARNRGTTPT